MLLLKSANCSLCFPTIYCKTICSKRNPNHDVRSPARDRFFMSSDYLERSSNLTNAFCLDVRSVEELGLNSVLQANTSKQFWFFAADVVTQELVHELRILIKYRKLCRSLGDHSLALGDC